MASPQKENGYTAIANELLEAIYRAKLNGTQFRIFLAILRFTYGFNRKCHEFSLGFLSDSIGSNKQQVKRELDKLIDLNIIIVVKEAGFNNSRILKINKNYDEWKLKNIQSIKKSTVSELDYSTVSENAYSTVSGLAYQERKYKDNIKKNTTTIAIYNGLQETGNQAPVAQVDADSTKQDEADEDILNKLNSAVDKLDNSPVAIIERHYAANVLNKTHAGVKDIQAISEVYQEGYPVDFIINCIDKACERYKANNNGKLAIHSFKYFIPFIKDEWEKKKLKEAAERIETREPKVNLNKAKVKQNPKEKQNYSSSRPKNRFHNFKQRHHKYSNEELEKILGIK